MNESETSTTESKRELIEINEYEFQLKDDKYKLKFELYSDKKIYFELRQTNILSFYYYKNNYNYEELTKLLYLLKEHYDTIMKVYKFYNLSLIKNKVELKKEEKKKKMILYLKRTIDFDEIESV